MIQGFCMGGGLLTALRADLRIASDDSQFGVPAARLGLGYGYGGVKTLVDLVGFPAAQEILLTGRRFPAADAARWGLVNRVTTREDLEPTVHELAATIAQNAPKTIRAIRRAIQEIPKDPDHRNLDEVNNLVQACFASATTTKKAEPPSWRNGAQSSRIASGENLSRRRHHSSMLPMGAIQANPTPKELARAALMSLLPRSAIGLLMRPRSCTRLAHRTKAIAEGAQGA